ncbi:MAG: insulinase family protein [Holosporales bacterium]|jgi:zinc protease|nr:insulinase family protein [Holosporales bacterium]
MKKRIACGIVVFSALLSGVIVWKRAHNVAIEEPRNIVFQEHNLDIKEIKIPSIDEPIWFVKTKNPTVAVFVCFRNEGTRNFKDKPGGLKLLFALLMQGAGKRNTTELKNVLDENDINFSADIGRDDSSFSIYVVPEKFQLAMDIAQDVLIHAHLPEEKIKIFQQEIEDDINQAKGSPCVIAGKEMAKLIYPPDHPYYITDDDVLNNINKYTKDDLLEIYKQLFDPRNAYVIIAGNISDEEVRQSFEKLFAELKKHKVSSFAKVKQKTEMQKCGEFNHIDHDIPQTIVLFTHPGVKSDSNDIFAAVLVNLVLGNGMNSRLFVELREKHGLVYDVGTSITESDMLCLIEGTAGTDPRNVNKLIGKIKDVFNDLAEKGITQEELDFQKKRISDSEDLSSAHKIVSFLAGCRNKKVPSSRVNSYRNNFYNLKLKDVNKVARKSFDSNKLTFVTVGRAGGKND